MQPNAKKEIRELLMNTRVSKIMTTQVHSVRDNGELSQAVRLISENNLTHVPVVDANKKVVGLISHMYIYKTQSPRRFVEGQATAAPDMILDGDRFYLKETLNNYDLKKIMRRDPPVLNQNDSIALAVHAMANKRIGCIPIVDDLKNLVGIITNQDILNFLAMALH